MKNRTVMAIGAVLLASGCGNDPVGPPLQPTSTVQELMAHIIDPAADLVWDAVGTVITEDGVEHWEPESDEDWMVVRNGAVTLVESANLLMIGDRARDQDTWMRMTQDMIEAGQRMLNAVDERNTEQVFALGEEVYRACDSCHNLYWVGDADRGRVGN